MTYDAIAATKSSGQTAQPGVYPGQDTSEVDRDTRGDLPATKKVNSASQADRVDISDVAKRLVAMTTDSGEPELQLSPEKLQEMAGG